MSAKLSLSMASDLSELTRIDAAIEAFAEAENWSPAIEFQIKLVFEEMGLNIMRYGFAGGLSGDPAEGASDGVDHDVRIEVVSDADSVTIEFVDHGRPFDPLTDATAPDLQSSIEDRPIGGLGVHLVRTMMDEARYRREEDRNHLTLVKRRSGGKE